MPLSPWNSNVIHQPSLGTLVVHLSLVSGPWLVRPQGAHSNGKLQALNMGLLFNILFYSVSIKVDNRLFSHFHTFHGMTIIPKYLKKLKKSAYFPLLKSVSLNYLIFISFMVCMSSWVVANTETGLGSVYNSIAWPQTLRTYTHLLLKWMF